MYICVLNNVTAIKTDQHLPILKISKGDITSRDVNPKTVEIDMEENENTYEDAVQKLSGESNGRKTITILDFAGRDIYYAFHQIYFSQESFCILVVDMRKDPKHLCESDGIYCSRFSSWTYKGNKI